MLKQFAACVAVVLAIAACDGNSDAPAPTNDAFGATSTITTLPEATSIAPSNVPSTSTSTATTTIAPNTSAPSPAPLPPIRLGFAGDTSFTHGLHARDPLGDITDHLSGPNLMIVNLETTVAEPEVGRAIEKRFTFKSPPSSAELLAESGVDVAALANNHALDYGPDAVIRTIEILDAANVASAGTGATSEIAYKGIRVDVEGWDVAVLSFSRVPCDSPEPGETYIDEVAWACPQFEELTTDAVAAAEDADFTIVMVHWGVQRQECPADHQHDLARKWIEAGADAIVGSHPHVLQGVARVDGAWVIHSTGNFAFPSARNASSYSAIFYLTITPGSSRLEAMPVRIVDGRPTAAISSRQGILDDLTTRSFGYTFGPDGVAVASPGTGSCG